MAHKKGVGSSKNGRESESKRLGVKLFGGEFAKAGNIIVRQRGTTHHPGENVGIGKDHSIYALIDGIVVFRKTKNNRSFISVQGLTEETVPAVAKQKTEVALETLVTETAVETEEVNPVVESATIEAIVVPEMVEATVDTMSAEALVAAEAALETITETAL